MKKALYLFLLILPVLSYAQVLFIKSGSIEFERSINVHKQVEGDEYGSFYKEMLATTHPFNNNSFTLYFDSSRTMYKPLGEFPLVEFSWLIGPAKENLVYTDYIKEQRRSMKAIFEENYLVKDSLNRIRWKISDETRSIAGFDCRKAVGRMCDSVYVTAFYTDEIPVSGGPESFGGLPGMILGLGIPRLHVTWFAKKVINRAPPEGSFSFPAKGKNIDGKGLEAILQKSLKDWGKNGQRNIWWTLL